MLFAAKNNDSKQGNPMLTNFYLVIQMVMYLYGKIISCINLLKKGGDSKVNCYCTRVSSEIFYF